MKSIYFFSASKGEIDVAFLLTMRCDIPPIQKVNINIKIRESGLNEKIKFPDKFLDNSYEINKLITNSSTLAKTKEIKHIKMECMKENFLLSFLFVPIHLAKAISFFPSKRNR